MKITDKKLERAIKMAEAEVKVLKTLKPLSPVKRIRVLNAVQILYGLDVVK